MSAKGHAQAFHEAAVRLILAKHSKYGPCDKPKDTKYHSKKYERFCQGQGGIDQRRGRMKKGHLREIGLARKFLRRLTVTRQQSLVDLGQEFDSFCHRRIGCVTHHISIQGRPAWQ
jgi:hypothetical protein